MDIKDVQKIAREFKKKLTVKVGILGTSEPRDDPSDSNYEIGKRHEFGEGGMKQRSFLRLTYMMKEQDYKKYLEENKDKFLQEVLNNGIEAALAEMGRWWVEEVQNTFEMQGYGNWPAISDEWAEEKGSRIILTHTGALKRSITFEVS